MPNLNLNDFVDDKEQSERMAQGFSDKDPLTTALLCLFLGSFGLHSFYVGRSNSGKLRLALGLLCVLLALMQIKLGYLFFLLALLLSLIDFLKITKGEYRDVNNKLIKISGFFGIVKLIYVSYFIVIGFASLFLFDSEHETSNSSTQVVQVPPKDIPVKERTFEALYKCKYEKQECAAEYNKRLEIAVQTTDSIYAEGDVREAVKLFQTFYSILKSDGSTISFEEYVPTKESVEKRIDNLLPQKGCIEDSLQYANYLSTIYEVEKYFDRDDDAIKAFTKYFNYLNRNCKLKHYDANVIITEERFIASALKNKTITKSKATALFNEIFKQVDKDDFIAMKSINDGKSYKGYGSIEMKKNRTVSYVEAPSKEFDAAMALMASAFNLFSFEANFPFVMHPSVENVEIGFNISELEYNWYAGYYYGIYAVTIKASRKSLDKYYEKNNIVPPRGIGSELAMSAEDKEFFSGLPSYASMKRWCSKNGFICSKYLIERTR